MKHLIYLLLCAAAAAGATETDDPLVRVTTSPCLGACPVYTFYLRSDGHYLFDGKQHTKSDKVVTGKVSPDSFRQLVELMQKNGFSGFEDQYGWGNKEACQELRTDHPSVRIKIQSPEMNKEVDHYTGCVGFAREAQLVEIEEAISALLVNEGLLKP